MARKQSPILDVFDSSNYWFVVQWLSRRFEEDDIDVTGTRSVMSAPLGHAIDTNVDTTPVREKVRDSWRALQKLWVYGWEKESNNKLPNADKYFEDLVRRTNVWLDEHFPTNDRGAGRERKRLLAAVRQQRLREKRKAWDKRGAIQVSISCDQGRTLFRHWEIPESKHHDVVRAALQLVLEDPELLAKAKVMIGVTA